MAAVADQGCWEAGEGVDGGGGAVVAQGETLVGQQPGHGALDDPAVAAELFAGVDAAAGDPGGDPAAGEVATDAAVVVPLIGVQLDRPPAGSAGARGGLDALDAVQERLEQYRVVPVRPDRVRLIGRPVGSTSRWYFVPALPRAVGFGPVSSPPFSPGR